MASSLLSGPEEGFLSLLAYDFTQTQDVIGIG